MGDFVVAVDGKPITREVPREFVLSVKMNYEVHGNTIPHLHMHFFPRYPGDPFEGAPTVERSALGEERQIDDHPDAQRPRCALDELDDDALPPTTACEDMQPLVAVFERAPDAVEAALAIQRGTGKHAWPDGRDVR